MNKKMKFAALALAAIVTTPVVFISRGEEKAAKTLVSTPPVTEELPEPQTPTVAPDPTPEQDVEIAPAPIPAPLPEPSPIPAAAEYIRCTTDGVNIRSGAGTDYAVLGRAEKGTSYAVVGKTGNWYKTYYKNEPAYIYASYAAVFELEKADDETEKVLEAGYKTIGVPYVYGAIRLHDGSGKPLKGFSTGKFDCSSLVQYAFYKGAGVLLNTTTRTQVRQGKYVKPSELKRGDCIYFTNAERQYNAGIERVGHVAIYLGGDYILHTSSDYARIEKMSSTRWNYYLEARRFL